MGSPSEGAGSNAPSDSRDSGSDNNKPDKDNFDRAVEDNSQRPDRAPASTPETAAAPDDDEDNNRPDDNGESSQATNTSAPSTPDATEPAEEEEDDRGFFDRAGDFFGGLARDVQDFTRENPRVDSYGNPVGLVDADGIQRGEVASRVRSSGTSSDDLAEQLGFSSPQDMAAAQSTDFIDDKYQEELARRAIEEALDERYGAVPADIQALRGFDNVSILPANSTVIASDVPPATVLMDDVAKYGFRTVTKALGPLGVLIDVMTPTPVADGTLTSQNTEASDEKIGGALDGAEPSTPAKQGNTRQYEKPGPKEKAAEEANEDFDNMELDGVRTFPDSSGKPMREGTLPDGRRVKVRETSSDGRPTLEIENRPGERERTKIRYGDQ